MKSLCKNQEIIIYMQSRPKEEDARSLPLDNNNEFWTYDENRHTYILFSRNKPPAS